MQESVRKLYSRNIISHEAAKEFCSDLDRDLISEYSGSSGNWTFEYVFFELDPIL